MKAYKATDKNMQCRGFQFVMNKEFIHYDKIEMCYNGFHFCKKLIDVFGYYSFQPYNKFFEVEIPDDAEIIHGEHKSVANKIKFIRELSSEDIKELTGGDVYIDVNGEYVIFGSKYFCNENGLRHRENGPAVVYANGDKFWYQNGKLHRVDGPAVVYANGTQYWYQNGKLHREDGPAIIRADGRQEWWKNGKLHREDGPAVIRVDGPQLWYKNDKLHRVDGPAVVRADGSQE